MYTLALAGAVTLGAPRAVEAQWLNSDIGITVGYSSATVSGSDVQNAGSISGFVVGISAVRRINEKLFVTGELLYSRRGASAHDDDEFAGRYLFEGDGTTDYVDLPLLFGLAIPVIGPGFRPSVHFGPYVGMNLNCNMRVTYPTGVTTTETVDDKCENIDVEPFQVKSRSLDYGFIAGVAVDFRALGLFARYQAGLAEISDGYDPRHRVITVGGRWSFLPRR